MAWDKSASSQSEEYSMAHKRVLDSRRYRVRKETRTKPADNLHPVCEECFLRHPVGCCKYQSEER